MNQTNNKGLTIIEVMIAIAIGAAVVALVLNAVGSARRSQRNNARRADIGRITASISEYAAIRGKNPVRWQEIAPSLENGKALSHYDPAYINVSWAWWTLVPANTGDFPVGGQLGSSYVNNLASCLEVSDSGACHPGDSVVILTNNILFLAQPDCYAGDGRNDLCSYVMSYGSTPRTPPCWAKLGDCTPDAADHIVIFSQTSCNSAGTALAVGTRWDMAVAYKLEGLDGIVCQKI